MIDDPVIDVGGNGLATGDIDPACYRLDPAALAATFAGTALAPWTDAFITAVIDRGPALRHGNLPDWRAALRSFPVLEPVPRSDTRSDTQSNTRSDTRSGTSGFTLIDGTVCTTRELVNEADRASLQQALEALRPWRKGPFRIAGIDIDCEWRSDWKWARLLPHIQPLEGRTVLDVGCGSGFHLWCMRAAGAAFALGIDPGLLFIAQFEALQRYIDDSAVHILPLTLDTLPRPLRAFDTVFSMGVLYHRRDHHAHLDELLHALRPGGELVLETLVSDSPHDDAIELDGRYARMRNIWCLPGIARVARWLEEADLRRVRCVSVDVTDTREQRSTPWMPHQSLTEALDAAQPLLTVEGHPRPRRAIFIAEAP